jgi:hypothetical protein
MGRVFRIEGREGGAGDVQGRQWQAKEDEVSLAKG